MSDQQITKIVTSSFDKFDDDLDLAISTPYNTALNSLNNKCVDNSYDELYMIRPNDISIEIAKMKLLEFRPDREIMEKFGLETIDSVYEILRPLSQMAVSCACKNDFDKFPIIDKKFCQRLVDFYIRMKTIGRYS